MQNIVKVNNEVPVVTLNDVIKFSGNTAKSTKELILKYEEEIMSLSLSKLEDSGENGKLVRRSSGLSVDWAKVELDEAQSSFLLTLMQNTEKVVAFKLRLIKEFMSIKEELHQKEIAKIKSEKKLCNTYMINGSRYASCRGVAQRSNLKEKEIKRTFEKLGYIKEKLVLTRFWIPTDEGLIDGIVSIDAKGTPVYNINETIDIINQYNNLED